MTGSIADLAQAFAETRDAAALQRLRLAVRSHPTYAPDLSVDALAVPYLQAGDPARALASVRAAMPGAFFSPSAHAALALAHEALGDSVQAGRERRIAQLALSAVVDFGEGTAARPWQVLRISDEYDVLRSQARVSVEQRLVTSGGRRLDRHVCVDGTQAWFDISLLEDGL